MRVPFPIIKLGQLFRLVRESHAQPIAGEPTLPHLATNGETAVTFIGHSSFLIQTAGRILLIDPVFATRLILLRRQRHPGLRIADLPRIDAVLITHAHMDHLNLPSLRRIVRQMHRRGWPAPVAIVPHGVEDLVQRLGFASVQSLQTWQSTDAVTPLTITLTSAKHWGARMFSDTHRGFGGYVIASASNPTLYHSGDSAYFHGFAEIGHRFHPQIALLPIGAYFPDTYRTVHTSPEEALQAFVDLGAKYMVPMHYNTFRLGREPMDEPLPRLLAAATKSGLSDQVVPLAEGQTWFPKMLPSPKTSPTPANQTT
jgi:L-ascorbate metabolism protein UlaG (beta-lactamase superfamily)